MNAVMGKFVRPVLTRKSQAPELNTFELAMLEKVKKYVASGVKSVNLALMSDNKKSTKENLDTVRSLVSKGILVESSIGWRLHSTQS